MRKHSTVSLCVALLCLLLLAGCGISEEEYRAVCEERDALEAELQELRDSLDDTVTVRIGGSFTVMVRDLIPDYVIDDTTPQVAVVTPFQSTPYTLHVGDLAEQLEIGRYYVFELKEKQVEMTRAEYEKGISFTEDMISRYRLHVSSCRPADESETGLNTDHIVMWLDEK